MLKRCPYCHRWVFFLVWKGHLAAHRERGESGQQKDHVTAPPAEQFAGPLDGVPQVYEHKTCGGCTRMPESIIRTYLAKPFTYGGRTFCVTCGDYYPTSEMVWTETGEPMDDYTHRLREQYVAEYGVPKGVSWPPNRNQDAKDSA